MDDLERELKAGFLEEASQLLENTEQCFLELESAPDDKTILEKIFRLAHNLKGSAKAVGFDHLGEFTHELESYLLKLKNGVIPVQAQSVSLLLRCNDAVVKTVLALKANFEAKIDYSSLLDEIRTQMNSQAPSASPEPQDVSPQVNEVAALLASETANSFQHSPEPIPFFPDQKEVTPSKHALQSQSHPSSHPASTDESIRVSLAKLEKLMNFVGELVILQTVLYEQTSVSPALRKTARQLGKVTKEVQDISMSLRMVPLKQTFQKMQRIVRDTSNSLNKTVHLALQGEETEVDKTVLERLGDPLVHLVRNAVDHGIESAEIRRECGKSEAGTVHLNAFHQSGNLVIEIRDDGAGLDPEKLKKKAIEKGILNPGVTLSDKDAYQLIFASGFSTKAEVSDISGRGVGMDVVKTNIESLQGSIEIDTTLRKGTCFRVRLPLTLAIIDGMVIRSENERFVIPLTHVHETVQPDTVGVHSFTGMGEILALRGENLPLYRMSKLLGRKSSEKKANEGIAIVVRTQDTPFSVLVDDILGQYQVVIKQLGHEHRFLKGFSGSAILGDGCPALILELPELIAKQNKPLRSIA
jgi:two-component system chemotaxis sensor kinase CheA